MFSAQGPPVKCVVLIPVKIRPVDERAALAQVWSVGARMGEKRGTASMTCVAAVIKERSCVVSGRGILTWDFGPWRRFWGRTVIRWCSEVGTVEFRLRDGGLVAQSPKQNLRAIQVIKCVVLAENLCYCISVLSLATSKVNFFYTFISSYWVTHRYPTFESVSSLHTRHLLIFSGGILIHSFPKIYRDIFSNASVQGGIYWPLMLYSSSYFSLALGNCSDTWIRHRS